MASSRASIESSPSPSTKRAASVSISSGFTSSRARASTMSRLISASRASAPPTLPPLLEVFFQYPSQTPRRKRSSLGPFRDGGADRLAHLDPKDRILERVIRPALPLHECARRHADRDGEDVAAGPQRDVGRTALEGAQPFGRRPRAL